MRHWHPGWIVPSCSPRCEGAVPKVTKGPKKCRIPPIQAFGVEPLLGWSRSTINYYGTVLLVCNAFSSTFCFMPRH